MRRLLITSSPNVALELILCSRCCFNLYYRFNESISRLDTIVLILRNNEKIEENFECKMIPSRAIEYRKWSLPIIL